MFSKRREFLWRRFRAYIGRPRIVVQRMPVVIDDADMCRNPIFLIGVHRSGTSLMRRVLNAHPSIACPPESYFLTHYAEMLADETIHGLSGMGYSHDEARLAIRRQASHFHEAFRLAEGKSRWADKTPQYVFVVEKLRDLFGDEAKFVLLFRDPYDVAASIFRRGWRLQDDHPDLMTNTAHYVLAGHTRMRAFAAEHADQVHMLRYENLTADPQASLRPLFSWLGEPWSDDVLAHHEKSHNFGTEDPVVRGLKGFVPSQETWRNLPAQEHAKLSDVLADWRAEYVGL